MQRLAASVLALLCLLAMSTSASLADKRVALVVGNGAYKNVIDLPNAPNDARDMAGALRRLGFLVVEGTDLTHAGMQDKLREFGRALVGADLGLFFYAGHGMQVAGENYLVPIGSVLKREADLEFGAIKVDTIVRQLSREAKIKVVILDSCRDNPLAAELARSMAASVQSRSRSGSVAPGMSAMDAQSVSGTMISFATAPGTVALDGTGRNSPFTAALLANIETPDLDIDLMMKRVRGQVAVTTKDRQQPWTNSSLTAEYYLNPRSGTAAGTRVASVGNATSQANANKDSAATSPAQAAVTRAATPTFDPRQIEFELWRTVQASNSVAEFNAYLQQYPNGTFADIARHRIAALQSGGGTAATPVAGGPVAIAAAGSHAAMVESPTRVEGTETTEQALNLDTSQWRTIQRKLTGLGYSTRGADGKPGAATRKAVRDWQRSRQFAATGYLDVGQLEALKAQPLSKSAARDGGEDEARNARRRNVSRSAEYRKLRRTNQSARGNQGAAGAAILGSALAIGAGIAIGRGLRRR